MAWDAGDLDMLASDDAREGALDIEYFREQRELDEAAAREREERFHLIVEHMREQACSLLLQNNPRSVEKAARFARAALRVEEWRVQAFKKGFGT